MDHIRNSEGDTSQNLLALVQNGRAIPICIDPCGKDYDGVSRVVQTLAGDIELVSGIRPEVTADVPASGGTVLIAGTLGQNAIIDGLAVEGRLDVSAIRGMRETYLVRVVEQPAAGADRAVVIAGSDKRGTLYGLFHLSGLIGVSPWVYWGDVQPQKRSELIFSAAELHYTSKEPSVRYRGFFLNDEWPSLGSWAMNSCGGFNELMYEKVFELLLRLKGNYLWPAMWSAIFSEDGKSEPLANARLADAYGIVMGTSHHEPLFRAGEEWQKKWKQYGDSNLWDYWANKDAIVRFWEDGVIRNKDWANIVTLGMRGEQDSALGGDLEENIRRLKDIILTQKELLRKHGLEHTPQALTIYKEVEEFWYGSETVPGLRDWEVLDDVTIILSDDNFGNVRKLPEERERSRPAGWGIYYHFDYHGGPRSYEWVNTVPLEKVWEQMSMAYDYGVRDVWIVNVGDLKPMELPLSYFMELAYDFGSWGTDAPNRTDAFLEKWVNQQFGHAADAETVTGITRVLREYTRLNGIRKPEVAAPDTFSHVHYQESQRMLDKAEQLEADAARYMEKVAKSQRDAYYQLVYYPAAASANVHKMQLFAGLNRRYSQLRPQSLLANWYARLVEQSIETDKRLQEEYNLTLSGGKWKGMMSSPHVGYVRWNAEGSRYPEVIRVSPQNGPVMIVDLEGSKEAYTSGEAALPVFTRLGKESYAITISNGGGEPYECCIESDCGWIRTDLARTWIGAGEKLLVSVDWEQLQGLAEGRIYISGAGKTVAVSVSALVTDTDGLPPFTFVEANGMISIEAEHFSACAAAGGSEWKVLHGYGRTLSSVKRFPTTVRYAQAAEGPYLEYRIYAREGGPYRLEVYLAPSNPLSPGDRLRYGIAVDGGTPVVADALPEDFAVGHSLSWETGVLHNIHTSTTVHQLEAGIHTLRFYAVDPAVVLQKLVLSRTVMPYSYFGPPESGCTGGEGRSGR